MRIDLDARNHREVCVFGVIEPETCPGFFLGGGGGTWMQTIVGI
jgi:hypothetical protein